MKLKIIGCNTLLRIILMGSLIICPLVHHAQAVYEFEAGYAKAEKIGGKDFGDGYFFIRNESESSTYFYVANPALNQVDSYKTLGNVILLGLTYDLKEIRFYFTWKETKDIHAVSFLKASGKFGRYKKIAKGIEYIASACNERDFFIVIFDSKIERLVIHKVIEDELTEINQVPVEDKQWIKFFKKNKFSFISEQSEISFDSAVNQSKAYLKDETLIMISDSFEGEEEETTKVISLNLKETQMKVNTLFLPYDKNTNHNSFLFNNTLYVLGIDRSMLGLNIYEFPSLTKSAELMYLKGKSIAFKASDLIENGRNLDQEWRGHWSDETISEQTFKTLNKGIPVIKVSQADSVNVRLTIGRNVSQNEPYRTVPITTSNVGTVNVPAGKSIIPGSVWGSGSSDTDKAYFYGYLNRNDFSLVDKKYEDHGSFDKANRRLSELRKNLTLGGAGVISSGKTAFLVFLNKKTKTFTIEKI